MSMVQSVPEWSLGDRMKKGRTDSKLSRPEMRDELLRRGFRASVSAISGWETDTSKPSDLLGVVHAWAEITGVPEPWLLGVGWVARDSNPEPAEPVLVAA